MRALTSLGLLLLAGCAASPPPAAEAPLPCRQPINVLAPSAEANVIAALDRLDRIDPLIHSVLAVDPTAVDQARAFDTSKRPLGIIAGQPVLIKDNIEAAGPLPTTAGSLALATNVTNRDAPLVSRLRAAGAVILGKTNLSEWANIRSTSSISGWSAVGGQTRNPWALDRNPCGSSSGSGAAVAAGLVRLAIGTETDGSITCPASINGIVGLKPTVGLVSRTHIVPISHSQDTPGPMAASVREAAELLTVIAGSDPADPGDRRGRPAQDRLCRGARCQCAEGQADRRDALRFRLRHRRRVRDRAGGAPRAGRDVGRDQEVRRRRDRRQRDSGAADRAQGRHRRTI